MELDYHTEDYLKDPAYSADLYEFMKNYVESFPGIDFLNLNIDAVFVQNYQYYTAKPTFQYSEDEKTLTINSYEFFNVVKNKRGGCVTPSEFYGHLKSLFDKAIEGHKVRTNGY